MKKELIVGTTLAGIIGAYAVGASLSPKEEPVKVDEPTTPFVIEKPKKVVYTLGQSISFIAQHCQGNPVKILAVLQSETIPTIDLSTETPQEVIEQYRACLSDEEIISGFNAGKKDLNEVLLDKAEVFLVEKKKDTNFGND